MPLTPTEPDDVIDLFRVDAFRKAFAIGPFFRNGVTLYRQQVRALNLVYSLARVDPAAFSEKRVAVIGGGVAGVTAAAAAAHLGCEVYLFEQRPVLCHLQHGCDTRWLHPHIYDWPAHGADNPFAGLPLLNWRAGTAAEVARQITAGFHAVAKRSVKTLHRHTGATARLTRGPVVEWENSDWKPRGGRLRFDLAILAVGFGVENGVREGATSSYWRNDSLNQPKPGTSSEKPLHLLISGTGDGGLVDLLRSRIEGFNHGRIVQELVPYDSPATPALLDDLRQIASEWKAGPARDSPRWLFERYSELRERRRLAAVVKRLRARVRRDTAVILNGRRYTFAETLNLDRASLFNTLVTYLLYELNEFTYVHGRSGRYREGAVEVEQLEGEPEAGRSPARFAADDRILRHGTNLRSPLRLVGLDAADVDALKRRQEDRDASDTSSPVWPAGWWRMSERTRRERKREPVEFVPPATLVVATTFVSTLSDVLRFRDAPPPGSGGELEFRATLHRLVRVGGQRYFQQVAHYSGTRTKGSPGRVFDVGVGLVGLACRLGRPVVIRREGDWEPLWAELGLLRSDAQKIDPRVHSLLACPFFAAQRDSGGPAAPQPVPLVLFMDSQEKEFFTEAVLRTVFTSCVGFARNVNDMIRRGDVRVVTGAPGDLRVSRDAGDESLLQRYAGFVRVEEDAFRDYAAGMTLNVGFFNAYLEDAGT